MKKDTIKEGMTGCGTYRVPDLIFSKEEEIDILVRNIINIKPLLEKYKKLVEADTGNTQDAFNQLEYYKDSYSYFYQELLSKFNGDKVKVEKVLQKKPGKVGRPRVDDPKDKKVMTSFTKSEHKHLVELAKSQGYSLSNLVRVAALKQLGKDIYF